jgi:hypothetical protein
MDPSFQTVRLAKGKHRSPEEGACVMELASMLSGQSFSDWVRCVCPSIGAFLRGYNDHLDDALRQDLYHYAAQVLETRGSDELAARRAEMCRTWARQARSLRPRRLALLRGTHARVIWSLRFRRRGGLDLLDCELAGAYAATMARRDRAWHDWTLGFIDTLCRVGSSERAAGIADLGLAGRAVLGPAPEPPRPVGVGAEAGPSRHGDRALTS